MAYNDDQAEIDAMSSMSTSNVRTAPVAYDPELRSQIGLLSRTIDGLSRKLDTLSEVSGIKGNHMPERIAASIGGPIGLSVVSAFKQLNLGEQISEKVGGLFSRFKGSKDGSNGGFINPASISKMNMQSAVLVSDTLKNEVSRPLITANSLAKQQQEIIKKGNIAVVKSIGQLNETIANKLTAEQVQELRRANNELIASIQKSNQKVIAEQRYKSSQQHSEETTINGDSDLSSVTSMLEKISEQLDSFQDPNGAKGGIFRMIADLALFRIRGAFYGKYSRQIPRSNNPLQTIADASLKMYEWQRLYGEVTKEQLNEVIRKLGGNEKKIVGRKGAIWEWMANNPESWQRMKTMLGNSDTVSGKIASLLMKGYEWNSQFDEENWADNILTSVKKSSQSGKPVTGLKDFYDRITGSGEFDVERVPDHISNMEKGPEKDAALAKWKSQNRVDNENLRRRLFNTWTAKQGKTVGKITTYSDPYFNTSINNGPAITPIHPNPIYNDQLDGVITGTIPVTIMGGAPVEKLVESSQHTAKYTQKIFDDDQGDEKEASAEARYNKYRKNQGGSAEDKKGTDDPTGLLNSLYEGFKTTTIAAISVLPAATAIAAAKVNKGINPLQNNPDARESLLDANNINVGRNAYIATQTPVRNAVNNAVEHLKNFKPNTPNNIVGQAISKGSTAAGVAVRGVAHTANAVSRVGGFGLGVYGSHLYGKDALGRYNDGQVIRGNNSVANMFGIWSPGMFLPGMLIDYSTGLGDSAENYFINSGYTKGDSERLGDDVTSLANKGVIEGTRRWGPLASEQAAEYLSRGKLSFYNAADDIASKYLGSNSVANWAQKHAQKELTKRTSQSLVRGGASAASKGLPLLNTWFAAGDIQSGWNAAKEGDIVGANLKMGAGVAGLASAAAALWAASGVEAASVVGAPAAVITGVVATVLSLGAIVWDAYRGNEHNKYIEQAKEAYNFIPFVSEYKNQLDSIANSEESSFEKSKKIANLWQEYQKKHHFPSVKLRMQMMLHDGTFWLDPQTQDMYSRIVERCRKSGYADPNSAALSLMVNGYDEFKKYAETQIGTDYIDKIYDEASKDTSFAYRLHEIKKLNDASDNKFTDRQFKNEIFWQYISHLDEHRGFDIQTGKFSNAEANTRYQDILTKLGAEDRAPAGEEYDKARRDAVALWESWSAIRRQQKEEEKKKQKAALIKELNQPGVSWRTRGEDLNSKSLEELQKISYDARQFDFDLGSSLWLGNQVPSSVSIRSDYKPVTEYQRFQKETEYNSTPAANMTYRLNGEVEFSQRFDPRKASEPGALIMDDNWLGRDSQKTLIDIDKLRATNKIYAQEQAMKPLIREVKEGSEQQVKAVNNNTAAVTTSVRNVNTTIINNNGSSKENDVPYYQTVTGTSGENL